MVLTKTYGSGIRVSYMVSNCGNTKKTMVAGMSIKSPSGKGYNFDAEEVTLEPNGSVTITWSESEIPQGYSTPLKLNEQGTWEIHMALWTDMTFTKNMKDSTGKDQYFIYQANVTAPVETICATITNVNLA